MDDDYALEHVGDDLLYELLTFPREQHFELLDEPRFQEGPLVESLLEASREAQVRDWKLSEHLAFLAIRLAGRTLDDSEIQRVMVRSGVLQANARRLAGRLDEAERALDTVALLAGLSWDRVLYCRSIALVRWEQGRPEEAAGWLEEAARGFSELLLPEHEGEALTLLGLLQAEEGLVPQSIGALLAGLPRLSETRRPWLTARGRLTLALNLAETGCPDEARRLLRKGRPLTALADVQEAIFLHGLGGVVLSRLGESANACRVLQDVRSRHLIEARLPETALVSLELAVVLAEQGRAAEIERLAAELEERFAKWPVTATAAAALRDPLWSEPADWRRNAEPLLLELRRRLRRHGPRPRPLPFA